MQHAIKVAVLGAIAALFAALGVQAVAMAPAQAVDWCANQNERQRVTESASQTMNRVHEILGFDGDLDGAFGDADPGGWRIRGYVTCEGGNPTRFCVLYDWVSGAWRSDEKWTLRGSDPHPYDCWTG